jgi:4-hydroxybenzoate polyprenyltransferase
MVVSLVLVLAGIVAALLSLLVLHWLSDAKFPDIARAVRDSGTDVGFLQNAYYHFGFLIALAAAAVAGLLAVFLGGPLRWVGLAVAVVAGLWHLSVLINRPEAPSGTLSYNFTPWLGLLGFALIAVGSVLVPSRRKEPVDRYPVNQTA